MSKKTEDAMNKESRRGKGFWGMAVIAVLGLALVAPDLGAREREGAQVIVNKNDGESVRGELLAVQEDNVILMDESSLTGVTIDVAEIRNVKVIRKGSFLKGAGIGFVAGAAFGLILNQSSDKGSGSSYGSWDQPGGDSTWGFSGLSFSAGQSAVTCGVLGGFIGGVLGATSKQTIEFSGKTPFEIHVNVVRLRKLAREQN